MKATTQHHIRLAGRRVDYRLTASRTARKLRVRVGPNGVQVVRPVARPSQEVAPFLRDNQQWVLGQIQRVESLGTVRRKQQPERSEILLRGELTPVRVEQTPHRGRGNKVLMRDGSIIIQRGPASRTTAVRSLENWLRQQARREIEKQLCVITALLKRQPNRVYVMSQRTKWGNCSRKRNLSFNWRLILAPDFVFRYLVTHEAAHLAVPNHSRRFWLTVQSLCLETEKAKQWFTTNGHRLLVALPNPR
jgi:predicted metal-dependent hydrolase